MPPGPRDLHADVQGRGDGGPHGFRTGSGGALLGLGYPRIVAENLALRLGGGERFPGALADRVGIRLRTSSHLTRMAALFEALGLDPARDIRWVTGPKADPLDLFAAGKIDAFLGFPPEPQELRAHHAGHVIVSTTVDRPWSQYFCCMFASTREYVRKHPIATKRVLRAVLKATDFCVTEPAQVARRIVDGGFTAQYDYARATLSEVPYDRWRDYDAEDTIRFYALRLRDAGMIKSSPQKIIAEGTDWRFLNELKRELKA